MKFAERVAEPLKTTGEIGILQMNITGKCNLRCAHCHVMKNSEHEIMSDATLEKCVEALEKHGFRTVDITGGEPTTHPKIVPLLKKALETVDEVILRTNAVDIDANPALMALLDEEDIHVVVSLPCYTQKNVDAQRGDGTYEKVLANLKRLNEMGYGDKKHLSLVYNPLGAFLPGPQVGLEADYKEYLGEKGVRFTDLYTITNMPMGFFADKLKEEGLEAEYRKLLEDNFNPETVENVMCRYQISVDLAGNIYDCDFHQAEGIRANGPRTIDEVLESDDLGREIVWVDYCYGCTAGSGSSCGGALE